jgi:hypothetical protein
MNNLFATARAGQNSPEALILGPFALAFIEAHIYEHVRGKHLRSLRFLLFKPFAPPGLLRGDHPHGPIDQLHFVKADNQPKSGVHQGNEGNEEFCLAPCCRPLSAFCFLLSVLCA